MVSAVAQLRLSEIRLNVVKHRPVVLIGFSGAGKTTVGRILAEQYHWKWVDVDQKVVEGVGRTIAELIREEGEQRFRELEREAISWALDEGAEVLSLGGGALAEPSTRSLLEKQADMVLLKAGVEEVVARVVRDERQARATRGSDTEIVRPLLANYPVDESSVRAEVVALMAKRKGLYRGAKVELDTTATSAADIAQQIVRLRDEWINA